MVDGRIADAGTYELGAAAIRPAKTPVFYYLEIPPFLFCTVVKRIADVGPTGNVQAVIEKPFGQWLRIAMVERFGS